MPPRSAPARPLRSFPRRSSACLLTTLALLLASASSEQCAVDEPCLDAENGTPCDDGLFCTTDDVCRNEECVGLADTCDDGIECTADSCDEERQQCLTFAPADACDEIGDSDGDGVADDLDACLGSLGGTRAVVDGCSPLDLIRRPNALISPVLTALATSLENAFETTRSAQLAFALVQVGQRAGDLLEARDHLGEGDICRAARRVGRVVTASDGLSNTILVGEARARALQLIDPTIRDEYASGDVLPSNVFEASLGATLDPVHAALSEVPVLRDKLAMACDVVTGRVQGTGVVESIDAVHRSIRLGDGTLIGLADGATQGSIAPGVDITYEGFGFGDGTIGGTDVVADPGDSVTLSPFVCVDLEIAPVQAFNKLVPGPGAFFLVGPRSAGELVRLGRTGFRELGGTTWLLEDAMRLVGAARSPGSELCSERPDENGDFRRYSLELELVYERLARGRVRGTRRTDFRFGSPADGPVSPAGIDVGMGGTIPGGLVGTTDATATHTVVLAPDFRPGDVIGFPEDIQPGPATLVVTPRVQACNSQTGCEAPSLGAPVEFAIEMEAKGGYCGARYVTHTFALEDVEFTIGQPTPFIQFALGQVLQLFPQPERDLATSLAFTAEAFTVSNNVSSHPQVGTVGILDGFAIYQNVDFFTEGILGGIFAGVDERAGLRWPRVTGTRNSAPFQYACRLPKIVRDAVNLCPLDLDDAFYRPPFWPQDIWVMGNGFSDDPVAGHCQPEPGELPEACHQYYAYDFGHPSEGVFIRAARGGRVAKVREDGTENSSACYLGLATCLQVCDGGAMNGFPCTDGDDCPAGGTCISDPTPLLVCETGPDAGNTCTSDVDCPGSACIPWCFTQFVCDPGNYTFIEHQDDTYGVYWHFGPNGIFVDEGERVRRGEVLGLNGNTGNSSAPHVHFHEQPCLEESSACWSTYIGMETFEQTCYEIRSGVGFTTENCGPPFFPPCPPN